MHCKMCNHFGTPVEGNYEHQLKTVTNIHRTRGHHNSMGYVNHHGQTDQESQYLYAGRWVHTRWQTYYNEGDWKENEV